jgi:hypothetical protein
MSEARWSSTNHDPMAISPSSCPGPHPA